MVPLGYKTKTSKKVKSLFSPIQRNRSMQAAVDGIYKVFFQYFTAGKPHLIWEFLGEENPKETRFPTPENGNRPCWNSPLDKDGRTGCPKRQTTL